ncbi:hypothetical protein ENSA5_15990 [Enhygromyxa salina]|uniref:Uncharacterized protein n=1 Tax=Enhygromyxa salina TaxID=215803 RepID=A0A2S9YE89_9BACT|nr:hypothetical protein [Enhygromyxa salina]PRQ03438.1 hypothetical protein ENSA5_15990 [Enhygromyxa salina]
MRHLGLALVLVAAAVACEPSKPSTPPEPTPVAEPEADAEIEAEAEPEAEAEAEPEPEAEPEAEAEAEVTQIDEAVFSKDGFEARDFHCSFDWPTRHAARYIAAGLADEDAALDACAPEGAAVEVEWSYAGGPTQNISVSAESSKIANCVTTAMTKVRAGVEGDCSAILLIGDPARAAAAYEAR